MMMRVMMTLIRLQKDAPSPSLPTTYHFVFRVTDLLPVCLSNWKHPVLSFKGGSVESTQLWITQTVC